MPDPTPKTSNPSAAPVDPAPAPVDPAPVDPAPAPVDPAPAPAPVDPAPAPVDPAPAPDPASVAGDWPEDWREKYAGQDEKVLKRLQRYASPKAALDALFHAQNRITSGELKSALKPDATPEEKAAWRTENGIPEAADKYDTTLKNGMVLRDTDKPIVDEFLKVAHDRNMRQEDVTEVLGWWAGEQQRQEQALAARDAESRMQTEDDLRAEYGPEYRRNLKIAHDLIPEDLRGEFMSARLPDGTVVGNNPAMIRWLVQLGREINPISTVVPGSGTNAMQAIDNEISSLRKMMGDHKSEYWRGPNAQKHQARYRELVNAQQKGR